MNKKKEIAIFKIQAPLRNRNGNFLKICYWNYAASIPPYDSILYSAAVAVDGKLD